MRFAFRLIAAVIGACALPAPADEAPRVRFVAVCNSGQIAASGACPARPAIGSGAADWGCTKDAATGLWWELKTTDGGLRDRDKTYSHFSDAYNPGRELGKPWDAQGFVEAVNAQGLCGARDWRLPTRAELLGIVRYGSQPAQDAAFFPDASPAPKKRVFWSASGFAGDPANAWAIDFNEGLAGDDNRSIYYAVRLVRGAPLRTQRSVSAKGDAVLDAATRLVWRRCVEGMTWDGSTCSGSAGSYNWAEAQSRARSQAAASALGWRVPSIIELASIVDDARIGPAFDATLFPAVPLGWLWSSTVDAARADYQWQVTAREGHVGNHAFAHDRHALRLVRDAP